MAKTIDTYKAKNNTAFLEGWDYYRIQRIMMGAEPSWQKMLGALAYTHHGIPPRTVKRWMDVYKATFDERTFTGYTSRNEAFKAGWTYYSLKRKTSEVKAGPDELLGVLRNMGHVILRDTACEWLEAYSALWEDDHQPPSRWDRYVLQFRNIFRRR